MSRFHAGFSVGTVAGALLGAAMVALGRAGDRAPARGGGRGRGGRAAAPSAGSCPTRPGRRGRRRAPRRAPAAAWREPRTLLIGVFVLAFAFAEGTGNDWIGVGVIDGYGTRPRSSGRSAFAVFLAAMTVGRWFGPGAAGPATAGCPSSARWRVIGLVGLLLFVFGGSTPLRLRRARCCGAPGVSLGFPVGMSAGADDPAQGGRAGQRGRLDRLLRLPRRAAADRVPRTAVHGAARADLRRRAAGSRRPHRLQRPAAHAARPLNARPLNDLAADTAGPDRPHRHAAWGETTRMTGINRTLRRRLHVRVAPVSAGRRRRWRGGRPASAPAARWPGQPPAARRCPGRGSPR